MPYICKYDLVHEAYDVDFRDVQFACAELQLLGAAASIVDCNLPGSETERSHTLLQCCLHSDRVECGLASESPSSYQPWVFACLPQKAVSQV